MSTQQILSLAGCATNTDILNNGGNIASRIFDIERKGDITFSEAWTAVKYILSVLRGYID